MVSSSSKTQKKPSPKSTPPNRITRSMSMLQFLKSHESKIPNIVYRQTARMSTMSPGEATKGKQLGSNPIKKETPTPFTPMTAPPPKRRRLDSHDLEDEDPEDDPDNEYAATNMLNNRRYESDEEGMGESYIGSEGIDESDEEERGDEDRHSYDEVDDGSTRSSDPESFTGSDNEDTATYDGYDSD